MNKTLRLGSRIVSVERPLVMGILNVTPDSFYDGGRYSTNSASVEQCRKMLQEGADIIDIGGYSSRPGATDIPEDEELARVVPVIKELVQEFPDVVISVDTFRSRIAREAVEAGAKIVNDISGGAQDSKMAETVAALQVPYILMHMKGTPQTMSKMAAYDDLIAEMMTYFSMRIHRLREAGVGDIIIDPGFGFAKTVAHNFEILRHLELFQALEAPMLIGVSRKSMIWRTLGTSPEHALNGTTALNMAALLKGASILRVHDVREAREVVALYQELHGADKSMMHTP